MDKIKRPVVFILLGVLIGIVCGLYLHLSIATILVNTAKSLVNILQLLFFLMVILVVIRYLVSSKIKKRLIHLIVKKKKLILIIFISFIISNIYFSFINNQYEKIYKETPKEIVTTATIVSEPKETEYYYSYEAKIENRKFIIYVKKNEEKNIKYGMLVKLKGEYSNPLNNTNYRGFNYKEYLKTKKIYGSIRVENISILKKNNVNIILSYSNNIRNKIIEVARNMLPNETQELLVGILIGEREGIEEETTKEFSKSSLSHILAISGSHISYIILGVSFLLQKSKIPRKGTYIITIIILIFFMLITRV